MKKLKGLCLIGITLLCSSCVSSVFSGAQLVYDRYSIQQGIDNHQIQVKANHRLFDRYPHLKRANISVITYNKDLIIIGQVPTQADKVLVNNTLKSLKGMRRFFNELVVSQNSSMAQSIKDSWLTTKLRTKMVAENGIDPSKFKVISENSVVYIMGDVKKSQANKVVQLAQNLSGVSKVIRILRYYHYA